MKIIKEWKDERYGATNTLYKLPNGTPFLHTNDPKTVDSIFSVVSRLGSFYNELLNVRGGTAHFLEHILAGNPNRIFKTKNSLDRFEFGSKRYPKIYSNAITSRQATVFHGTTNYEGETRLLKRISSMIQYDRNQIEKYIEKERKIILAELGQRDSPEKNTFIKQCEFMFGNLSDEYKKYPLGTEDDIQSISVEDLEIFNRNIFTKGNVILSLQSPNVLAKDTIKYLYEIDNRISKEKITINVQPGEKVQNIFKYKHFQDDRAQNIHIEFDILGKDSLKMNYENRSIRILSYELIDYLLFQILREKKGYIYSSERFFESGLLAKHNIKGIAFATNIKNLKNSIDEYYKIITVGAKKFLTTKSGMKWFESQVSGILFPNTRSFDSDYARSIANNYLQGFEIYDYSKFKKAVLKITMEDLVKYIEDTLLNTPHHVWIVSNQDGKNIERIFKQTQYLNYQSNLKPIEPV